MSLNLVPPRADARARWVKLLVQELEHCERIGIHLEDGPVLRTMVAHRGTWRWSNDPHYAYRCILPSEVVFDIGDDRIDVVEGEVVRTELEWKDVVEQSEALWDELDTMLGPEDAYYATLSGGKGTHTHLFLENPTDQLMWDGRDFPKHDLRESIMTWIVARRRMQERFPIDADPACIAPSVGGRQLREFGAVKNRAKTLFFVGPRGRKSLPATQAEAYASAGLMYPLGITRCRSVDGLKQALLTRTFGRTCPSEASCFISQNACRLCPY